jgi:hypothetical protein
MVRQKIMAAGVCSGETSPNHCRQESENETGKRVQSPDTHKDMTPDPTPQSFQNLSK